MIIDIHNQDSEIFDNALMGQSIKRQRKDFKYSQKNLAKKIGRSQSIISKYESGDIRPRPRTIKKLERVFQKNLYDRNLFDKPAILD